MKRHIEGNPLAEKKKRFNYIKKKIAKGTVPALVFFLPIPAILER